MGGGANRGVASHKAAVIGPSGGGCAECEMTVDVTGGSLRSLRLGDWARLAPAEADEEAVAALDEIEVPDGLPWGGGKG